MGISCIYYQMIMIILQKQLFSNKTNINFILPFDFFIYYYYIIGKPLFFGILLTSVFINLFYSIMTSLLLISIGFLVR